MKRLASLSIAITLAYGLVEPTSVGLPVYGGAYSVTCALLLRTKRLPDGSMSVCCGAVTPFVIVSAGPDVYGGAYSCTLLWFWSGMNRLPFASSDGCLSPPPEPVMVEAVCVYGGVTVTA